MAVLRSSVRAGRADLSVLSCGCLGRLLDNWDGMTEGRESEA